MLLLHGAVLIFQWAWSKVAAIYIFVNKLPCRLSMGKGRSCFLWKMKMLSVPELVLIVLAYSTWHSWGEKSCKCGDQKPIRVHSIFLAWLLIGCPKFAQTRVLKILISTYLYLYYCTPKTMLTKGCLDNLVCFSWFETHVHFFSISWANEGWESVLSKILGGVLLVVWVISPEEASSPLRGFSLTAKRI